MQAAPPILKAKSMHTCKCWQIIECIFVHKYLLENDRPDLKDIENFVVPYVHHCWYKLGLQLLDPGDVAFLKGLRSQYQNSSDQCTEVFMRWLDAYKKPTWNKIIEALNSNAVNLPNVAYNIEKMVDQQVSTI